MSNYRHAGPRGAPADQSDSTMAIDSVRLLTDSAAQLYRRLGTLRPLEQASAPFDVWLGADRQLDDQAEAQALRRDYRRLVTMIDELETLVRSRALALALVRERAAALENPRGGERGG